MAYLKIGTREYKPHSLLFARNVSWAQGSGRNQANTWVGDLMPDKCSVSIGWSNISENELQQLLIDTNHQFLNISFIDPMTKSLTTIEIYKPTVKWGVRTYTNSKVMYKDVSFEAVER